MIKNNKRLIALLGFGLIVLACSAQYISYLKTIKIPHVFGWLVLVSFVLGIIMMLIGMVNYLLVPTWAKILLVVSFTLIILYILWCIALLLL